MPDKIVEEAKCILRGVEVGSFHIPDQYEVRQRYEKYFGDSDFERRKYSLAVFMYMLGRVLCVIH